MPGPGPKISWHSALLAKTNNSDGGGGPQIEMAVGALDGSSIPVTVTLTNPIMPNTLALAWFTNAVNLTVDKDESPEPSVNKLWESNGLALINVEDGMELTLTSVDEKEVYLRIAVLATGELFTSSALSFPGGGGPG